MSQLERVLPTVIWRATVKRCGWLVVEILGTPNHNF